MKHHTRIHDRLEDMPNILNLFLISNPACTVTLFYPLHTLVNVISLSYTISPMPSQYPQRGGVSRILLLLINGISGDISPYLLSSE